MDQKETIDNEFLWQIASEKTGIQACGPKDFLLQFCAKFEFSKPKYFQFLAKADEKGKPFFIYFAMIEGISQNRSVGSGHTQKVKRFQIIVVATDFRR
jgi:hypothetical protein